ncbi:response regulator [Calderihabitans maritimus]|uniref:Stage 0 sporulation protein A homolog n=1 Tax=Calderihabitans maritimus TaxID=1246530 RepID=A0A1Z5HW77_9FIRM|nr:response regulator [Calderihabitans maritimus]GAW93789.1 response regulator receiver protein [Calderihabitans maritimus]
MTEVRNRPGVNSKILVVDDQPGVRQLINEALKSDGYLVHTAANGKQALREIKENTPAVVLLDLKMPGMNGLELLQEIKKSGYQGAIITMTAYGELDLLTKAQKLGVDHHLTKPFDINDLRGLVRKVIEQYNYKKDNTVLRA